MEKAFAVRNGRLTLEDLKINFNERSHSLDWYFGGQRRACTAENVNGKVEFLIPTEEEGRGPDTKFLVNLRPWQPKQNTGNKASRARSHGKKGMNVFPRS